MQRIMKKCSKMFALIMAFILMFNTVGPITVKATGNTADNVLRQEDFENLSETDSVIGAIGTQNKASFSLGTEEENKYAAFTYSSVRTDRTLFSILKREGATTVDNKALWITMDLRLPTEQTNSNAIKFVARNYDGSNITHTLELFTLNGNSISVGGTVYAEHDFNTWKTVVCKLDATNSAIYIENDGNLTLLGNPFAWEGSLETFYDILVSPSGSAKPSGAWQMDNVAIYQNDEYVDLFASSSSPDPAPVYVAQIGDVGYTSLQEAIGCAVSGDTIKLLGGVIATANETIINSNITLDLNGYTLDMGSNYLISYGDVVDNSTNKAGRLKVDSTKGELSKNNSQMPIYIDGEGYMLATMKAQATKTISTDLASFTNISRPSFGAEYAAKVANGAAAAKLQFILRLDWGTVTDGKYQYYQEFSYSDTLVQNVYTNGKAFSVTVNGLTNYAASMKVTELVISDLGVVLENNSFYMKEPSGE